MPLTTEVWEGIGEWREFIRSLLHLDHPDYLCYIISFTPYASPLDWIINAPAFQKMPIRSIFLPSSLASHELLACRRCYLEVVFPPHVIRCYLRVLHKGDSRCHSSRYATGAMRPPSPRKATQHDRHKKVRY